jgi:flagellar hook-associated protein 1
LVVWVDKGDERMSLNSIMNIATSGLYASQRSIRTVTNNVANVNTPGYVRLEHTQQARFAGNPSAGVEVGAVRRAADRFLQAASLAASSSAGGSNERYQYLDSVQGAFGDPTSDSSIFGQLDRALGSFESAVSNPGSMTARRGALSDIQNFLSRLGQLGSEVQSARGDADRRVGDQVSRVNTILVDISRINSDLQRASDTNETAGAKQRQSTLIDELATYIDIRSNERGDGTTEVRSSDGVVLAGYDHASLSFSPSNPGSSTFDRIKIQYGSDPGLREFEPNLQSGSLRGLLDVRDKDLSAIALGIGELAGGLTDALNAAHNQNTALPPIGRTNSIDTGLLATDLLNFKGKTTVAVLDANGVLKRKIEIDFDGGTLSVDGGVSASLGALPGPTIGSFQTALNTALGTLGSATFTSGKLSLVAAPPIPATAPANGFAFDEPDTGGSSRGNKAFAHFFGLNDLVRTGTPPSFATGLTGADAHGFSAGEIMRFSIRGPNGAILLNRDIAVPAGTVTDMMDALNNVNTGLGLYGGFSLDAKGQMKWTPAPGQGDVRLDVVNDVGPRGDTTRGFAQLFGLSATARETRATSLSINSDIAADPRKLAFARPDLSSVSVGQVGVGLADSRGAQALFDVSHTRLDFNGLTGNVSRTMTLADYASSIGGDVGTRAAQAETDRTSATAFSTEAAARRSNVEGVNLDEELVKLTSYQQAYSAAARMIRAADEMYQALLNAV